MLNEKCMLENIFRFVPCLVSPMLSNNCKIGRFVTNKKESVLTSRSGKHRPTRKLAVQLEQPPTATAAGRAP